MIIIPGSGVKECFKLRQDIEASSCDSGTDTGIVCEKNPLGNNKVYKLEL